MNPKITHILKSARQLIAKPSQWTQGHYAVTARGRPTYSKASKAKAVKWCAAGVIYASEPRYEESDACFDELNKSLPRGYSNIVKFNDSHTHAEVLSVLDKTIKRLERNEKETRQVLYPK